MTKSSAIKVAAIAVALVVTIAAHSQPTKRSMPLRAHLTGTLNGNAYEIRVPDNWNGTLLVWAHGSASSDLQIAPPVFPAASPTLQEQLLSAGYALAGSFYADSEKEASLQILALTNYFKDAVGTPQRTIVWGLSLGGGAAQDLIERYPQVYDGAIAVAAMAGRPASMDQLLRYDLAYAAVFGWPSDRWGPIENIRNDLYGNEGSLIMPVFRFANSQNRAQWEFIRLVMKESTQAWWTVDRSAGIPGYALAGWAATAVRSHWQDLCGGPAAQNIGDVYTLADDEKAYLSTLGVDANPLLDWMNARTNIAASPSARLDLGMYSTPSGRLRRPVVRMHGIFDAIQPPTVEAVYRGLAEAWGNGDKLLQVFVSGPHGSFSAEQYLSALAALNYWLDSGMRPDASLFPEGQGFDNSFVPPAWPY